MDFDCSWSSAGYGFNLLRSGSSLFAPGFFLKKNPEANSSNFCFTAQSISRQHAKHRAYRGWSLPDPYLLISPLRKRPGLDADSFETGRGRSRPVKTKLHRLKLHFVPLQLQLLTAKSRACKE